MVHTHQCLPVLLCLHTLPKYWQLSACCHSQLWHQCPNCSQSTSTSANLIQFHEYYIECKADLCSKKLLPPLARNATAISTEATILVSWVRSNNLWCMWTESLLITIAFAHSIQLTSCTLWTRSGTLQALRYPNNQYICAMIQLATATLGGQTKLALSSVMYMLHKSLNAASSLDANGAV